MLHLPKLNFPEYDFKIKKKENKESLSVFQIFDPIRKKFVVLTPEEWVRQNLIQYLIREKQTPSGLISVETGIKYNKMQKRCDIMVFNKFMHPVLLAECKSSNISISQSAFDQIALYNMSVKVKYLVISNGLTHLFYNINHFTGKHYIIQDLPVYTDL